MEGLSQLYETVVLRDLLQYITPGLIALLGLNVVIEALVRKLGLGISVFEQVFAGNLPTLVLTLLLSYVFGILLTATNVRFLRGKDKDLSLKFFKSNQWLQSRISKVISSEMGLSEPEATGLLGSSETAETMREIGRSIVQHRLPALHREFVGRHSILSRFCQNLAIAIIILLVSIASSIVMWWNTLPIIVQPAPVATIVVVVALFVLGILSVRTLVRHAARLRDNMTKHTFEIWYVQYLESRKAIDQPNKPTTQHSAT